MNDSYVIYVIDCETTSLEIKDADVIEISMSRLSIQDNSYKEDEHKTWYLRAMNPKGIQDKALAVNGHKREDILGITSAGKLKYQLPNLVVSQIETWIMDDNVSSLDRIFAGQNPHFDIDMLQELWKRNNRLAVEDFPFSLENNNRIIDTKMIVAFFDLCTGRRRKAYGLGQLVKACSIKKDKAHSATGDVAMTRDLLLKLVNMVKPVVVEQFKNCYVDAEVE